MAISSMDDIHRFTVDEYVQMALLNEWERTELIEGVVFDSALKPYVHGDATTHVYDVLNPLFPDGIVLFGATIRLGDFTAVDPDVLVIDGTVGFDEERLIPAEAVKLVVEVSVSTQAKDLGSKLQAYAAAGIPQYWVVDPRPEAGYLLRPTEPRGSAYARTLRYEVGEGAGALDVAAVLAGEF